MYKNIVENIIGKILERTGKYWNESKVMAKSKEDWRKYLCSIDQCVDLMFTECSEVSLRIDVRILFV